jgi:hypothetical protein
MKATPLLAFLALATLVQTGCVVGRRTIDLPLPQAISNTPTKGQIAVSGVKDARIFQNRPPEPSTPSIDGDVATLTDDQQALMIGRQRNTYGMALGDVALPANTSIKAKTRSLVEEGLRRHGYDVTSNASAANKAEIVVVEFWGWSTPGMFTIPFEARVSCTIDVTVDGKTTRIVVNGYGINHAQMASDANWQKAYTLAFNDFLVKLDAALAAKGL